MTIGDEPQDDQESKITGFLTQDGLTAGMSIPALTDDEIAERGSENDIEGTLEEIEDSAIACQDLLDDQMAEQIGVITDGLSRCPGDQILAYLQEKASRIREIQAKLSTLAQSSQNQDVANLATAFAELLKKSE
jgi:hypothetical protein